MSLFSKDAPPSRPQARQDATSPSLATQIGPNVVIDGTITGSEPVFLEGTIKGTINLTSDLRVGLKARVEATVHARNVVVEGKIDGDISADDRVELIASASVDGNIKAPKIVVAEGARFRGSVDMGSVRPKETADVEAVKAKT